MGYLSIVHTVFGIEMVPTLSSCTLSGWGLQPAPFPLTPEGNDFQNKVYTFSIQSEEMQISEGALTYRIAQKGVALFCSK